MELARICGVRQPAVSKWLKVNKPLPAKYVLRVEAATGIPGKWLNPDIYPTHNRRARRVTAKRSAAA